MDPLAYHNQHLAWQQRVQKEVRMKTAFYTYTLHRTFPTQQRPPDSTFYSCKSFAVTQKPQEIEAPKGVVRRLAIPYAEIRSKYIGNPRAALCEEEPRIFTRRQSAAAQQPPALASRTASLPRASTASRSNKTSSKRSRDLSPARTQYVRELQALLVQEQRVSSRQKRRQLGAQVKRVVK